MKKFLPVLCFLVLVGVAFACDALTEAHNGCKIENSQCMCSFGCKSEFRYKTKKECTDALKGRSADICSRVPCMNGGACIQTSIMPGYKCRCEGTRHYGPRCNRPCPRSENLFSGPTIPFECIEI